MTLAAYYAIMSLLSLSMLLIGLALLFEIRKRLAVLMIISGYVCWVTSLALMKSAYNCNLPPLELREISRNSR